MPPPLSAHAQATRSELRNTIPSVRNQPRPDAAGRILISQSSHLLERLGVPVEDVYTAVLADDSRVERIRGRTVIRLEGREFPTPVTFGEAEEQSPLGAMALEDAMLAVDTRTRGG